MSKKVPWFTVIADEVTDMANKQQLSLLVRYVHPDNGIIREDLLTFLESDTGVTGSRQEVNPMMVQETCLVRQRELRPLLHLSTHWHYIFTVHHTAST